MIGRTNTGGGGGGGLNFRVIGGTSAPSNPKENDIWVNSGVEVNGYIFSAEATPSNIYETELTCVDNLSGQYIGENGEISTNQNFAVSDYVELPKTTTHITVEHSITASSVMYHAFYDNNKNFISSVFRENMTMVYEVPPNAAYARLSLCIKEDRVDNHKIIATVDDGSIVEGTVLITIGTSSAVAFNALKKNDIMVYPVSAKQYNNGEWVNKTAKSYQGGAWVEWLPEGALYWHGNECVDITGGWTSKAWKLQSDAGTTAQTFNIARNSDHLMFTKTGQIGAVMYATNPIDLTNVKAIHFKGEMSKASKTAWVAFHVWTSVSGNYWATNSKATVQTSTSAAKTEFTLDVSNLSGSHYVGFGIYDSNCYVKVEELYLEVA